MHRVKSPSVDNYCCSPSSKMKLLHLLVLIAILGCAFGSVGSPVSGIRKSKLRVSSRTAATEPSQTSSHVSRRHDSRVVATTTTTNSASNWRGPACILGGALAHLTLGTLYCWGSFLSYSPAYLRFFDGLEHIGSQPDALYVIPFTILAQAMAMPFGPSLVKILGASQTMLLGSWIAAAAVYFASYQKSLSSFILFYSFMFGTGAGLAYTAPMAAGWKWMPKNKGLVSGGILAGFGAGGFIFSLLGSKLVNPERLNAVKGVFPDSVYGNFPAMLRTLAMIYAVVSFVGSRLVSEPVPVTSAPAATCNASTVSTQGDFQLPQFLRDALARPPLNRIPLHRLPIAQIQQQLTQAQHAINQLPLHRFPEFIDRLPPPVGKFLTDKVKLPCLQRRAAPAVTPSAPIKVYKYSSRGLSVPQALGTSQYWLLWSMIITCATAGLNTATVYKQFAATSSSLTGDQFQTLVGGVGALFNGLGRLFWGSVLDKIGFRNTFTVLSVLQAASMLTYFHSTDSKTKFALNTCLLFFTLAGNFALFPPAVQRIFGPEAGTVIYGLIYSAFALASVVGGFLTKMLVVSLGWEKVFQVMAFMSLVATALATLVTPVKEYEHSVV